MTDMKRVTVAFPDRIDAAVLELQKTDQFCKCSYSEVIRQLVGHGLDLLRSESAAPGQDLRPGGARDSA